MGRRNLVGMRIGRKKEVTQTLGDAWKLGDEARDLGPLCGAD